MAKSYGAAVFFVAILVYGLLPSCDKMSETDRMEIKSLAGQINSLFIQARKEIEELKITTQELLDDPEKNEGLYNDDRYKYTKNYVYYTPKDDGHCEMWASGYMPIGASEIRRIKALEHLCPDFQKTYDRSDFADAVYLTTYDSIIMAYPYADMHAYLKPGLDLTKIWVTYWAAAEQANPEKRTLWVNPYIDAIGRGYTTSIITPIYKNDFLEGTLGIDITVDLISNRFISLLNKNLMIVTRKTIPVAINKNGLQILKIKGLERYYYLNKEAENKSISSSLMMSKSNSKEIRSIAKWILSPENEITLEISGKKFIFLKEDIPEIGWFLVEFKEK